MALQLISMQGLGVVSWVSSETAGVVLGPCLDPEKMHSNPTPAQRLKGPGLTSHSPSWNTPDV